jgi:hypothetical protein
VNQGLVANLEAFGLRPEAVEHLGIEPDRDELPGLAADRRPPDATHGAELCLGQLWDVREVNRRAARGTPYVPGGSRAAR